MDNLTMHDPLLVSALIDMYFGLAEKEEAVPTVPGLVLAVGFDTVGQLTAVLKSWDKGTTRYPDTSIRMMLRALTRLEDHYLGLGLQGKIPPALLKFTMGAYHDRREAEPSIAQQGDTNNNYQIVFNAPNEFMPHSGTLTTGVVNQPKTLAPSDRPQSIMVDAP